MAASFPKLQWPIITQTCTQMCRHTHPDVQVHTDQHWCHAKVHPFVTIRWSSKATQTDRNKTRGCRQFCQYPTHPEWSMDGVKHCPLSAALRATPPCWNVFPTCWRLVRVCVVPVCWPPTRCWRARCQSLSWLWWAPEATRPGLENGLWTSGCRGSCGCPSTQCRSVPRD